MIENTVNKVLYDASGTQRNWDVPFAYKDKEDVKLFLIQDEFFEDPVEVTQNFEWNGDGTSIIYPTEASGLPLVEAGKKVLVIRETPLTQLEDSSKLPFTSQDMERALDKLTMETQDNKTQIERSLRVPYNYDLTPNELMKNLIDAEEKSGSSATAAINAALEAKASQAAAESAAKSANDAKDETETDKIAAEKAAQTATNAINAVDQKVTDAVDAANRAEQASADTLANATKAETAAQTATTKAAEAAQSAKDAAEAAQNLKHATETTYGTARLATQTEASEGVNDEAVMTPLKTKQAVDKHASLKNNPHSVTKAQIGLGNVDNTSDANKPVSGPQQTALDLKSDKTYVDGKLSAKADLVNGKVPAEQLPPASQGGADITLSNVTDIAPNSKVQVELDKKADKTYVDGKLDTKADLDLANTGRITNCITKIPQDIKLELSADGILTLKAGSKVYDGAGNDISIKSDKTTTSSTNGKLFALLTSSGATLTTIPVKDCVSGETDSLAGKPTHLWYDTFNKVVNYYGADGVSVANTRTLPIALITVADGKITSIDQVFNGFGYIGSTVFALPGVEGLIPSGRNADGSLKNTITKTASLLTLSMSSTGKSVFGLTSNSLFSSTSAVYDSERNLNYNPATGNTLGFCNCGYLETESSGKITSFKARQVFHAVDYSDTEWASTQGKPSGKYIDLTLGASGSKYTAPANGWISISKKSSESNQYVNLYNATNKLASEVTNPLATGSNIVYLPVKKGDIITINYNAGGVTNWFRFIYDEGAK